jgi:hypothetical protein
MQGRWPSSAGRCPMALSVSVSQRNVSGKAAAGTCCNRQALKPTISSAGQSPSTSGRWVKGLPEQKMTLSRCRRGKSGGRLVSWLSLRLSTSSVSARPYTSGGRWVRPAPFRSRRRVPVSAPLRKRSKVCMGRHVRTHAVSTPYLPPSQLLCSRGEPADRFTRPTANHPQ